MAAAPSSFRRDVQASLLSSSAFALSDRAQAIGLFQSPRLSYARRHVGRLAADLAEAWELALDKPRGLFGPLLRWMWVRVTLLLRGMTLGVRVIALNEAGQVVLVRHGYTPGWHLPGGGVDYGETMVEAAARELEEETGAEALGAMTLLGIAYNRSMWRGDHVAIYAAGPVQVVRTVEPGYEIREIGWFDLDALPDATTDATRARLAEWQAGEPPAPYWS